MPLPSLLKASWKFAALVAVCAGSAGLAGCAKGEAIGPDDDDDDDVITLQDSGADAVIGRVDAGPDPDGPDDRDAPVAEDAAVPIDAPDLPPDAALPPDASGCTVQTIQLLTNPAFESGPGGGWVEASSLGYGVVVDQADLGGFLAQTPAFLAWLGGDVSLTDSMYQQVTIPAGATDLSITGYLAIGTNEAAGTVAYDTGSMTIRSTSDALLATLGSWSNLNVTTGWTAISFLPAGSFAGQTIRLRFDSSNDFVDHTNFFFDSLALNVTVCQ
jgi:hypothetical protein